MAMATAMKKRQRVGSIGRLSSSSSLADLLDGTLAFTAGETSLAPTPGGFNDSSTADVLLHLSLDPDVSPPPFSDLFSSAAPADAAAALDLYLHSSALRRSQYFDALLSDRWKQNHQLLQQHRLVKDERGADGEKVVSYRNLKISPSARNPLRPFDAHITVLRLLYTLDFHSAIHTVADALDALHVALELVFDECVRTCVEFLEAVPWTEDEERMIVRVVPLLRQQDSQDLLARVVPPLKAASVSAPDNFVNSSEEMLHELVLAAIHSNPTIPSVKTFVTKLLNDFSLRESVHRVLDRAFLGILDTVKKLLSEYASPDFRVAGDNEETEAMQRVNLHSAAFSFRKLLWIVERMIELRMADTAVREWSEQAALAADLQKAFKDERNIAAGLPVSVMRCTGRLVNAVASGSILSIREVRKKLVKDWLPVVNACRDMGTPLSSSQKLVSYEMEETFLKIISTLPISDSRELLQQCLSFSTRNVEDCPHLISAFNTWFRRANLLTHDGGTS